MWSALLSFHHTEGEKECGVHCFSPSVMWGKECGDTLFHRLPNSTNAVESYNRLCKGPNSGVLSVAMMMIYKLDMAATLRHLAVTSGMSVTYERQTPEARSSRASEQSRAHAK